jgi:hypothetical protein
MKNIEFQDVLDNILNNNFQSKIIFFYQTGKVFPFESAKTNKKYKKVIIVSLGLVLQWNLKYKIL